MKIKMLALMPTANCNEHLAHGPISIDLGPDIVLVVRCRDCKHWQVSVDGISTWCTKLMDKATTADDFCSFGERKDSEGGNP